jgi:hypothetical protein
MPLCTRKPGKIALTLRGHSSGVAAFYGCPRGQPLVRARTRWTASLHNASIDAGSVGPGQPARVHNAARYERWSPTTLSQSRAVRPFFGTYQRKTGLKARVC